MNDKIGYMLHYLDVILYEVGKKLIYGHYN